MAAPFSQVFLPESFQELFSIWENYPDAVLYSGGTEFVRRQGHRAPVLPPNVISLGGIAELKKISRTERYLEIGAMVKLNQIMELGKIVPEALTLCLENIGGHHLRNLATMGGNIYNSRRIFDIAAPMNALDAQYELRTVEQARWVYASRFVALSGGKRGEKPSLENKELLTRIRVPLEPWTYTWFYKFRCMGSDDPGGCILFMIRNQKDILTNIKVVYAGKALLREKNAETMLEGKRLPLVKNDVEGFMDKWKNYLSTFKDAEDSLYPGEGENFNPELSKTQILNFIKTRLLQISN